MPRRVIGHVQLTLAFEREGAKWVGTCIELGTSTYARTLKQSQLALRELVIEHLNLLEEAGERERFFKRWDIEILTSTKPPTEVKLRAPGLEWPTIVGGHFDDAGPFYQPGLFSLPERRPDSDRELVAV